MQKSNKRERGKEKRIIHVKPAQSKPGWEEESSLCVCHHSWFLWLPFFSTSPFLEIPVALDLLLREKKLNSNCDRGESQLWLVGRSQRRSAWRAPGSRSTVRHSPAPGRARCPLCPCTPAAHRALPSRAALGLFWVPCPGCWGVQGMDVETGAVPEVQAKLQGKGHEQSLAAALLCCPCPLALTGCRLWGDGGHAAAWTCGS